MNDTGSTIAADFANTADAIPRVLQLVDRVGEAFHLPAGVLTDLRIALDEVVTNIVKYAYPQGTRHEFTIRCALRDGCLQTIIEDDGAAFDPLHAPPPDLSAPLAKREIGGLGVYFVKNLMSAVSYERVDGRNRLTLEQRVEPRGDPA